MDFEKNIKERVEQIKEICKEIEKTGVFNVEILKERISFGWEELIIRIYYNIKFKSYKKTFGSSKAREYNSFLIEKRHFKTYNVVLSKRNYVKLTEIYTELKEILRDAEKYEKEREKIIEKLKELKREAKKEIGQILREYKEEAKKEREYLKTFDFDKIRDRILKEWIKENVERLKREWLTILDKRKRMILVGITNYSSGLYLENAYLIVVDDEDNIKAFDLEFWNPSFNLKIIDVLKYLRKEIREEWDYIKNYCKKALASFILLK